MKKLSAIMLVLVVVTLVAPAAFAQEAAGAANHNAGLLGIAAAFGMGIAAFGGALGQGKIASAACEGIARNPGAGGAVRAAMILGLVFVETLALFTLAIIFAKIK
jgi:F-type H+-transporting ATPase subunit c